MSGAVSASTLASVSTGLQIAGTLSGARGSYRQSQATQDAYEYQAADKRRVAEYNAAVLRNNAQVSEWQAQDSITRGQRSEQVARVKTAQLKGSQRARLAANGVALDEGSALNILNDTDYMGELDALTIRDNAAKEAWGHRVQASNARNDSTLVLSQGMSDATLLQSRADAESPAGAAFGTLLTGAGSVASSWYSRKTRTG